MRPLHPIRYAAVLTVALFAASGAGAQTGAGAGVSDGMVKIGLLLDMSGPYSDQNGTGSAAAAKMAVEDFGGKVLGAPIELVVADHHDDKDQAGEIARRWFGPEHVDAVLDVAGSSEAVIVQAIGRNRDKIVSLSAARATRLTNEACSPTGILYNFDTYAIAHTLGNTLVKRGADTWFFITVDYSFGYDLERDMAAVITANGGKVLGHARHPLDTKDFSSYLLQAQQSKAKAIAVANAGTDMINTVKQAAKLGIMPRQVIAPLSLRFTGAADLGLEAAQGLMVAEPFYWDLNDATREWSKRFFARISKMPNSSQAALYSSIMHYLKAVASAGTDATDPVMAKMRSTPIDDFFTHDGHIRADGAMVHDMRLFQIKTPAESKYPWDYYRLVETIPGEQAFQPLSESKCPLVKQQGG
ncbi:MAG TPA: ABC transporter substrate-binding protein [Stellaceae bacterium]|nr:ABC transporter substrate-binding protein [Stellaceae bacterium]